MADLHRTIEALYRIESPRLIAALARLVRDVGDAEELAQDALLAALQQWPATGIPDNPGAWLMAAAKHRAIDLLRRKKRQQRKHQQIAQSLPPHSEDAMQALDASLDDPIGDDLLRLIFTTCHPALSAEARSALTLRLVAGLTTDEIARAFLVPEPTIAQRIVRAKRTLTEKQIPIELPAGPDLPPRLASVLEVIYLLFNEGYTATAGEHWLRADLCQDALRLARILAELAPQEPEVHALAALLEIQSSRLPARTSPTGTPILLLDQNRARWDHLLIRRGIAALSRAAQLHQPPGPYFLQASIAACHATAATPGQTNWQQIADLYAQLATLTPSPIIELNRAVAISMSTGPAAGLLHLDTLATDPALKNYHLLPSIRGDFLFKLHRLKEAQKEFQRAASLTQNAQERTLLQSRAAACDPQGNP